MIRVVRLEEESMGAYRQFLSEEPQAMIYASPEYAHFLANVVTGEFQCLLAFEGDDIVGSLPYFRTEHPDLGCVINSLPWYGSHGGCTLSSKARSEVRAELLLAYRRMLGSQDVLSSTMILTPSESTHLEEYRRAIEPYLVDRRIGQVTCLPGQEEDLEDGLAKRVAQKTRNLIRKSLKQGFSIEATEEEEAWRFLSDTHHANMHAIGGKAKPWHHFLALRKCLPGDWHRLWVATADGQPVAALLLLYFNQTVEYFTPVILHEYRFRQPLSYLIWHAMLDAARRGYRWWNWGGTWLSQKSLHHFKAGWGAGDEPYWYLINTNESALARLRANQTMVQAAFPYYYTHPYSEEGSRPYAE